jgi:hypothetical protein
LALQDLDDLDDLIRIGVVKFVVAFKAFEAKDVVALIRTHLTKNVKNSRFGFDLTLSEWIGKFEILEVVVKGEI